MREFFELVNEYPWTTVLLFFGLSAILGQIAEIFENIFKRRK